MKKIAFVGCAHIHTPAFVNMTNARNNVQVVAVWDHNQERGEKNAALLKSTFTADINSIWNNPEIDGVVICSETNLHRELVSQAAASGKHMFVEKPLGFSACEAKEMAEKVAKAGVIFQTGYFMRGRPEHVFLKQQIEAGAFGKITRVRHSNCHCGSLAGWFDTDWRWMANPDIAGCGAFGDLGTHSLDILMWWFGVPEKVTANINVLTARYGEKCDEYGEGTMIYPNGLIATIAAGWVDCSNPVVCEICGTEGHAVLFDEKLYFQSSHVKGAENLVQWTDLPEAMPHAFELFLDAFLDDKNVPLVPVQDAADRNVVMSAFYEANQGEKWVKI